MNLPLRSSTSSLESPSSPPPKLLEQLRIHLRTRHYSIRTEQTYIDWARRFILFHGKRHPRDMGAAEVEAFRISLAVERKVSASTQNQAKAALLYLYKQLLGVDLPWLDEVVQAKTLARLGTGNMCLQRLRGRLIRAVMAWSDAAMCYPSQCSGRCGRQRGAWAWKSQQQLIQAMRRLAQRPDLPRSSHCNC